MDIARGDFNMQLLLSVSTVWRFVT